MPNGHWPQASDGNAPTGGQCTGDGEGFGCQSSLALMTTGRTGVRRLRTAKRLFFNREVSAAARQDSDGRRTPSRVVSGDSLLHSWNPGRICRGTAGHFTRGTEGPLRGLAGRVVNLMTTLVPWCSIRVIDPSH